MPRSFRDMYDYPKLTTDAQIITQRRVDANQALTALVTNTNLTIGRATAAKASLDNLVGLIAGYNGRDAVTPTEETASNLVQKDIQIASKRATEFREEAQEAYDTAKYQMQQLSQKGALNAAQLNAREIGSLMHHAKGVLDRAIYAEQLTTIAFHTSVLCIRARETIKARGQTDAAKVTVDAQLAIANNPNPHEVELNTPALVAAALETRKTAVRAAYPKLGNIAVYLDQAKDALKSGEKSHADIEVLKPQFEGIDALAVINAPVVIEHLTIPASNVAPIAALDVPGMLNTINADGQIANPNNGLAGRQAAMKDILQPRVDQIQERLDGGDAVYATAINALTPVPDEERTLLRARDALPQRRVIAPMWSRFGVMGFSGIPFIIPSFNLPQGESKISTANHIAQWLIREGGVASVMFTAVSTANTFVLNIMQEKISNPQGFANMSWPEIMAEVTQYVSVNAQSVRPIPPSADMLAAMGANALLNPFTPVIEAAHMAREYGEPFDWGVMLDPKVMAGIVIPVTAAMLFVLSQCMCKLSANRVSNYDWNNPALQSTKMHIVEMVMQMGVQTLISCLAGTSTIPGLSPWLIAGLSIALRPVVSGLVVGALEACKPGLMTGTGDLTPQTAAADLPTREQALPATLPNYPPLRDGGYLQLN
jgi:hypothetical protein